MTTKNLYKITIFWSNGIKSHIDGPMDNRTLNRFINLERWLSKCLTNDKIIKICKKTLITNISGKDIIRCYNGD